MHNDIQKAARCLAVVVREEDNDRWISCVESGSVLEAQTSLPAEPNVEHVSIKNPALELTAMGAVSKSKGHREVNLVPGTFQSTVMHRFSLMSEPVESQGRCLGDEATSVTDSVALGATVASLKKGEIEEGEDASKVNPYGEVSPLRCGLHALSSTNCFGSLPSHEMPLMTSKEMEPVPSQQGNGEGDAQGSEQGPALIFPEIKHAMEAAEVPQDGESLLTVTQVF